MVWWSVLVHWLSPGPRTTDPRSYTPFSDQFRRQCMQFGNSTGNFVGSAVRRPVGHDSTGGLSKLVALIRNSMQIVHDSSEKGVVPWSRPTESTTVASDSFDTQRSLTAISGCHVLLLTALTWLVRTWIIHVWERYTAESEGGCRLREVLWRTELKRHPDKTLTQYSYPLSHGLVVDLKFHVESEPLTTEPEPERTEPTTLAGEKLGVLQGTMFGPVFFSAVRTVNHPVPSRERSSRAISGCHVW